MYVYEGVYISFCAHVCTGMCVWCVVYNMFVCMVCLSYMFLWSVGMCSVYMVCVGICAFRLGLNMQSPRRLLLGVQPLEIFSAGHTLDPRPLSDHGDHPWAVFLFQAPGAQLHCPLSVVGYPPSPAQSGLQNEPQSLLFVLSLLEETAVEPPAVRFSRPITMGEKIGGWGQVKYPVAKMEVFIMRG